MTAALVYRYGPAGAGTFRLNFSYAILDEGVGFVRKPIQWMIAMPPANGFAPVHYGTSEVRGLFGGVRNEQLAAYSESAERAIGTAVTVGLCELLDHDWHKTFAGFRGQPPEGPGPAQRVLILGPALPKIVGRVASLRPPAGRNISWLTPRSPPSWLGGQAAAALLPPLSGDHHNWRPDEEDPLIRTQPVSGEPDAWIRQDFHILGEPARARTTEDDDAEKWLGADPQARGLLVESESAEPGVAGSDVAVPDRAPLVLWLALSFLRDWPDPLAERATQPQLASESEFPGQPQFRRSAWQIVTAEKSVGDGIDGIHVSDVGGGVASS